jgi:hypothetical protein
MGPYVVRSLHSGNYKTGGIHRQQNPLIQTVRMHQHIINSAELQTVRCLKTAAQRGTRQIKDGIAEKTKEIREGKWMHG